MSNLVVCVDLVFVSDTVVCVWPVEKSKNQFSRITAQMVLISISVILYISFIMGNVIMSSTVPLFFETACEVTYPVAEGVTNLVLTLANNIAGLVFLLIQMIPNIGKGFIFSSASQLSHMKWHFSPAPHYPDRDKKNKDAFIMAIII